MNKRERVSFEGSEGVNASEESTSPNTGVRQFDYVIVGAGPSAMGILYSILEENNRPGVVVKSGAAPNDTTTAPSLLPFSIAIVERGHGPPHDPSTQEPHRWYESAHNRTSASHSSSSVRLYPSTITGRRMEVPVGQGLGGSSNINACLCLPPLQEDLELWPEPWKSTLVGTAGHLSKVLEKNECLHCGSDKEFSHNNNFNNPFRLSSTNPSSNVFALTGNVPTLVRRDVTSDGRFVRENYYSGLVEPLLQQQHPHLQKCITWFRGVEAQRLLVDGTKVVGVKCIHVKDESLFSIHATRRIILCAGAIESPALLLVSAPGRDKHLSGIGKNLQDQALLARAHLRLPFRNLFSFPAGRQSVSGIAGLGHTRGTAADQNLFQVAVADSMSLPFILPGVTGMVFRWKCRSSVVTRGLDLLSRTIQVVVSFVLQYSPIKWIVKHFVVASLLCQMHPQSKGHVRICLKEEDDVDASNCYYRRDVQVQVDPGYLHDDQDLDSWRAAWEDSERNLGPSFVEIFPKPILLLLRLVLPKDICFALYCRCFLQPYYHFSSTCAMKTEGKEDWNGDWVVDSSLRLRGYDNIYVCDASVFPTMISNPPALTCASLGYQFGKMILENDGCGDDK